MLYQLTEQYIQEAFALIQGIVKEMKSAGSPQWDDTYPSLLDVENDIVTKTAFGYFEEEKLIAYMVLNEECSPEYDEVVWKMGENPLFVHRLSVTLCEQGKGIARKCMLFAERYAKENNYDTIRLDTYTENPIALRLYDSLGYAKVGVIQLGHIPVCCYEKNI